MSNELLVTPTQH